MRYLNKKTRIKSRSFCIKLRYLLIPVLIFSFFDIFYSGAQGGDYWSEPTLLFQVNGAEEIFKPVVISDSYGNIHVFWSVTGGDVSGFDKIYYTRLDALGWTTPVDIIAAETARAPKVSIGQDNFLYLIWFGIGDSIFYSRAPLQEAELVKNWSEPSRVTESSIHASVVTSHFGNIYLAHPGVSNTGVFVRVFVPNDTGWSSPKLVSQTSLTSTGIDDVNVEVSPNGVLHVVWTEYYLPDAWPPRGVFYARSIDGGISWSEAVMLAGDGYDEINISIQDDANIHVAWNGMVGTVGGRYYRMSSDGGETWSQTFELVPAGIGGTEGPPQIGADSSGALHVLTTYNGCAWYTFLLNRRWAPVVCISREKEQGANYLEDPAMTVSEGNRLHAVFWNDYKKRLWYVTKKVDAPWIPPETVNDGLYQPTPASMPSVTPSIVPAIHSPEPSGEQLRGNLPGLILDPGRILVISIIPVIVLIVFSVVLQSNKKGQ